MESCSTAAELAGRDEMDMPFILELFEKMASAIFGSNEDSEAADS